MTRTPILLHISVITILLTSCSFKTNDMNLTDMPIKISDHGKEEINFDVLLENSYIEIIKWLPDAYYGNIVYHSECQKLPNIDGKVEIFYWEVHDSNWQIQPQVFSGNITVNTTHQIMDIRVTDETDHYALTIPSSIPADVEFKQLLQTTNKYLQDSKIDNCLITLAQFEDRWHVSCYSEIASEWVCDLTIDGQNLDVISDNSTK